MDYLKIKDRITQILKIKGLTTKQMASDLGFTPQGYRLWFVEGTLRVRTVIDISQYLDIDPADLLFPPFEDSIPVFYEARPSYKNSYVEDRISTLERRVQLLEKSIE
ncbi:helix-turn-helix transcriptional regulator [bacterium SCSIO 12643]|nr:helix-turn-helix transcriptional regulator [bacterium SCSIO 12643]